MNDNIDISFQAGVLGCFLGGAVGDALGAPIEFMTLDHIRDKYGFNSHHCAKLGRR